MHQLPDALAPLAQYRQFIAYLVAPSKTRPGKTDKFPVDPHTGHVANAHDRAIWTSAQEAIAAAATLGASYGVGFVFTRDDPFWFLDIDECLLPDRSWSPLAQQLVAAFPGAAVEVSNSGRGLHIFGTGSAPAHACKNAALGLEFYTDNRFVALTGVSAVGHAGRDMTAVLPWLVQYYFPPAAHEQADRSTWTEEPCAEWRGPLDDETLLARAMRSVSSRAAFGAAASFADLWEDNADVLAGAYPDPSPERAYDRSSADAALAQHLAFWTGRDCARMERLMRQSALRRDKWDREDYLPRTILAACAMSREVLTDRAPQELPTGATAPTAEAPRGQLVTGDCFLPIEEQLNTFRGCTYIADAHKVLVPGGALLNPDRFRVMFGGYTFPLDQENRNKTRDSWEAFTQSQAYRSPRADGATFRPDLAPGAIVEVEGQRLANVWWPVNVARQVGDVTPFLRHLALLLPDERDREIVLCYMAAVVQHKGIKFQWAPLIQGVEGNGKSLLSRCVAAAVGDRYTFFPKASQIAKNFNAWQAKCVFAAVEDIYVADSQQHVMEELKPMVTGKRNEIEGKGQDQVTMRLCFNMILNSNHRDAIRKHRGDTRFAIFFTAQQELAHLTRDGMTPQYFEQLHAWLDNGGYAIVAELLHTYPINPEYNPANGRRAPITSSTDAAIAAALGPVEQEVLEAVEQGLPGFAGGWVSSIAFDRLLQQLGRAGRIPLNKRRELLQALGYDWHPGLPAGRVNNIILPDAGKPRLFVRIGHPAAALVGAAEIARAYTQAQTVAIAAPALP